MLVKYNDKQTEEETSRNPVRITLVVWTKGQYRQCTSAVGILVSAKRSSQYVKPGSDDGMMSFRYVLVVVHFPKLSWNSLFWTSASVYIVFDICSAIMM